LLTAVMESVTADVWSFSKTNKYPSRSWFDPCVSSNACILAVSVFLIHQRNLELALLAFLLFCASMAYHRSAETWSMAMYIDVVLGRICCLYYIFSTSIYGSWDGSDLFLKLAGYLSFAIIAAMTTGPYALEAKSDAYNRYHPLVHILGVIPPTVGGILCRPFLI
jgi:hypothetical protein